LLSRKIKIKIYRTIILPVILYGCESWSLILREECRLRVFENKVLRRIFGPKRDEVTGKWRRLLTRSFMLCTPHQYHSGDQVKKTEMGRTCGTYGREERCIQDFSVEA
jgi:hypothetical protein